MGRVDEIVGADSTREAAVDFAYASLVFPTRTPDELLAEALELPADTRARLAESLIPSLDESGEEVDPAELEDARLASFMCTSRLAQLRRR